MNTTEGAAKKLLQGKECAVTHIQTKEAQQGKARSEAAHRLYAIITEEIKSQADGKKWE